MLIKQRANIQITDKQGYEWLIMKLNTVNNRSKMHAIIKAYVQSLGNWCNRQRGDPSKGYRAMKEITNPKTLDVKVPGYHKNTLMGITPDHIRNQQ